MYSGSFCAEFAEGKKMLAIISTDQFIRGDVSNVPTASHEFCVPEPTVICEQRALSMPLPTLIATAECPSPVRSRLRRQHNGPPKPGQRVEYQPPTSNSLLPNNPYNLLIQITRLVIAPPHRRLCQTFQTLQAAQKD